MWRFVIAFLALTAVASADPSADRKEVIGQYKVSIGVWTRYLALAYSASICGYRSDAYWETFHTYDVVRSAADMNKYKFSNAEIADIEAERKRIWLATVQALHCSTLVNSPELDEIDQIRHRITGGYQ